MAHANTAHNSYAQLGLATKSVTEARSNTILGFKKKIMARLNNRSQSQLSTKSKQNHATPLEYTEQHGGILSATNQQIPTAPTFQTFISQPDQNKKEANQQEIMQFANISTLLARKTFKPVRCLWANIGKQHEDNLIQKHIQEALARKQMRLDMEF